MFPGDAFLLRFKRGRLSRLHLGFALLSPLVDLEAEATEEVGREYYRFARRADFGKASMMLRLSVMAARVSESGLLAHLEG